MPKGILLEEFHVTLIAPRRFRDAEYRAIRRTVNGVRFQTKLGCAIRDACSSFPSLSKVRVVISR